MREKQYKKNNYFQLFILNIYCESNTAEFNKGTLKHL